MVASFTDNAVNGIIADAAKRVIPAPAAPAAPATVNPFDTLPDFIGTGSVKDARTFAIDTRDGKRAFAYAKDKDGKRIKDANGEYKLSHERVSLRAAYGEIVRAVSKLPGADTNISTGTVDYTTGARVRVVWRHNGKDMDLIMRVASVIPHPSGKAEDVNIRFAVRQADGTYREWPVKIGHIRAIASAQ